MPGSSTPQTVIAQLVETMRALAGAHIPDSVPSTPRASSARARFVVPPMRSA